MLLIILIVAAVPRLAVIPGMTAFVDELTWFAHTEKLNRILADGPAPPEKFGQILRHPGVIVAVAAEMGLLAREDEGDRLRDNQIALSRGRQAIVWTGILACVLLALLAASIYGPITGSIAGLLLAISPYAVATSGWLQCDAALMLFSMVSVLAFCLFLRARRNGWLYLSGISFGLAIASKMPALALAAVVGPVFLVQWTRALASNSTERWRPLIDLLRWSVTAFVVLYLVWPRMWLAPMELVDNVLWARELGASHPNYFLGEVTAQPPWYYYLVVVPFRLSSIELLGLLFGALFGAWRLARGRRPRFETWILLAWGLVFWLAMSLSGKKLGARYVLPLWPLFALLIARFWVVALGPRLSEARQKLSLSHQRVAAAFVALLYLTTAAASMLPVAPDLFAYANPLLGGLSTLGRITTVYGVAEKGVAQYLDTLPADRKVRVAGHVETLTWYTNRPLERQPCAEITDLPDYLVVFSYDEQRCPAFGLDDPKFPMDEVQGFVWDDAVLARVYELRRRR